MKIEVKCRRCRKTFEFETEGTPEIVLEMVLNRPKDKFVVPCPHCRTENVVEIDTGGTYGSAEETS